jgi:hypothetical protein
MAQRPHPTHVARTPTICSPWVGLTSYRPRAPVPLAVTGVWGIELQVEIVPKVLVPLRILSPTPNGPPTAFLTSEDNTSGARGSGGWAAAGKLTAMGVAVTRWMFEMVFFAAGVSSDGGECARLVSGVVRGALLASCLIR